MVSEPPNLNNMIFLGGKRGELFRDTHTHKVTIIYYWVACLVIMITINITL